MKKTNSTASRHCSLNILLAAALVFAATASIHAQNMKKSMATLLETTPDAFIQKNFTSIGKVSGIHISLEGITDLTHNKKMNALEMEYTPTDNSITASVLLDPSEADSLVKFLNFVTGTLFKSPAPIGDREFSFVTLSGFEAGCYWNKGWDVYVRIDTHNNHTNVEFSREDLIAFQSLLMQAKTGL